MNNVSNIENLSPEEINYLCNDLIAIFTRVKEELQRIQKKCEDVMGDKPKVSNISLSAKGKLFIILKKLAHNVTVSSLTGIDPMFLDNDLNALRANSYESFMKCDLTLLVYHVTTDALNGTEELINRLQSPEERMEMLKNIDNFYMSEKDRDYMSEKSHDYTVMLVKMFKLYSNIYNDVKRDRFMALTNRGYDISMPIDFFEEIRGAYSKLDIKTDVKGK